MSWRHYWHREGCEPQPDASLYLIDAPASEVVSIDEMKAHLRVDSDDENELIEAMTEAVTQHLDGRDGDLGRALIDQTWELRMEWFPQIVRLPLPPLIEVLAIEYLDDAGARQTFDASKYEVTGERKRGKISLLAGECWPRLPAGRAEPAIVRFRAGYIDGGVSPPQPNVPGPIKAAIKLMTGTLYQNRERVVVGETAIEIPWAAEAMLRPYRVMGA